MKKIIAMLLVLVMSVTGLVGCGSSMAPVPAYADGITVEETSMDNGNGEVV